MAETHATDHSEAVLVDRESFRDAMARLGAAVTVVTTDGPAGRHGFTASAVCSVSDLPPTILVCVNRRNTGYPAFLENAVFCVNVLTGRDEGLSPVFGGVDDLAMDQRFAHAEWGSLATGSPVLRGTLAAFDCRVAQTTEIGTHTVLFGEVLAITTAPVGEGLMYFGRAYHRLAGITAVGEPE